MTATGTTTRLALRYTGDVASLSDDDRRALFDRTPSDDDGIAEATARIVADVRARGDAALRDAARRFDGVDLDELEVPRKRIVAALNTLPRELRAAMARSVRNIAAVHRAFAPAAIETSPEPGIVVGRRPDALARVGVYAPGGRAAYPSSVLMGAIPAKVAGVGDVILCSPPGTTGLPSDVVLAAAALCDVDRVFAVGGAGAVAAMAFGTATIPRVDRIVGPGNAYVASAKLQVAGAVGIDSPAGPSELLVIADESADPELVAMEMVAQAEHDPRACVIVVVVGDERLADEIEAALARAATSATKSMIVRDALAGQGGVLRVRDVEGAIAFSNAYAPEHLLLLVADAAPVLEKVRNAGTVFVGAYASVAFGDYMTGANHVLPTGGSARTFSGLSPLDFVRWTTYQRVDASAGARLSGDVATFALSEGLPAHAAAAVARASNNI